MSVDTTFTVLFMLLIVFASIAALYYTKIIGGKAHYKTSYDASNAASNRETERFNMQEYVASNFPVYGVCNMGTSLDEREIHRYEYSRMGLQPE